MLLCCFVSVTTGSACCSVGSLVLVVSAGSAGAKSYKMFGGNAKYAIATNIAQTKYAQNSKTAGFIAYAPY